MNRLFDILPGISMPVPEVTRQIAAMWREEDGTGDLPPSNAHALQLNLIVHFGLGTSEKEGQSIFDVSIGFSQRYPCRIIVLCPEEPTGEEIALDAKLFSQCFLGEDLGDRCCCEVLILGYGTNEVSFLENQLSVWLTSDLPVYHWLHRASIEGIGQGYQHFLGKARRVVFDSAIDGSVYDEFGGSHPEILSDLANARTARLRQSLGQFLAATPPRILAENLREVTVSAQPRSKAEAQCLLAWQQAKLQRCALDSETDLSTATFRLIDLGEETSNVLESNWIYESDKSLSWKLREGSDVTWVEAAFNGHSVRYPLRADPFRPAKALAEALFFQ